MLQVFVAFGLSFLCQILWASGGHEVDSAIPVDEIKLQILNFSVFSVLLYFALRKPVANFFSSRANNYEEALHKASQALAEATSKKQEIESKLEELRRGHKTSVAQAQSEAEKLKANLIKDAQTEVTRMLEEAEKTVRVEIEKAKTDLRNFMLQQAVSMADKGLGGELNTVEQKRLQKEFVEKIQVIR